MASKARPRFPWQVERRARQRTAEDEHFDWSLLPQVGLLQLRWDVASTHLQQLQAWQWQFGQCL